MKAKCNRCGDTVEVARPREYKSCKCGAIALDYGDGEDYFYICGNPEDFDGDIEDAPKIRERNEPVGKTDNLVERTTDAIGEENIEGESGPVRDPDNPSEVGVTEMTMDTTNARLVDTNLNNIGTVRRIRRGI